MRKYDAASVGAVTVFAAADCTHEFQRFMAKEDAFETADYTLSQITSEGLGNDVISSVMVPQGYSVILWDTGTFTGNSEQIDGPYWRTGDDTMKMTCQNVPGSFNDKTSSLTVFRTQWGEQAIGDWIPIFSATEGIDYTCQQGWSQTTSQEVIDKQTYNLTMQLSSGITMEGLSESETITQSYTDELTVDAKSSMTKSGSDTFSVPCTGQVGPEGGVGLWQWIVKNANDGTYTQTHQTVCRYGSLYNVKPTCPWNACANGDCSECRTGWKTTTQFLQ